MDDEGRPLKMQKLSHQAQDEELEGQDSGSLRQPPSHSAKISSTENDRKLVQDAAADPADDPDDRDTDLEDSGQRVGLPDLPNSDRPMSKNQMKKLRKAQEWEAGRDLRKARRKERIAAAKKRKRALRRGEADHTEGGQHKTKSQPPKQRRPNNIRLPITFVLDCGFDDLMTEKERISLGSQLTRSYSDNHRAPFQAHLVVSSWGGLLKERFDTVLDRHYENWRGIKFVDEDFVQAAAMAAQAMKKRGGGQLAGAFASSAATTNGISLTEERPLGPGTVIGEGMESSIGGNTTVPQVEPKAPEQAATDLYEGSSNGQQLEILDGTTTIPGVANESSNQMQSELQRGEVIYLTSDSPHTLDALQPYHTYVVGALVDKNRHKGVCYKTACEKGVRTAKLPIGQYMEMQSRFVLATNHVVEIMVKWLECGHWGDAFMQVIPKRKGGKLKTEETHEAETDISEGSAKIHSTS